MDCGWLAEMIRRHPSCREEDVVKALFQSLCGNGHLLTDRAAALQRLTAEMDAADGGEDEPLTEEIGGWLRLNLRPARRLGLKPAWIAGMMAYAAPFPAHDRAALGQLADALPPMPGISRDRLHTLAEALIAHPDMLPSHSAEYYRAERPSYRLIDARWLPVLPVLVKTAACLGSGPVLITIDGPSCSGKSTLSSCLGQVLGCPVVHTDDYVIPKAMKTPERLAVPGGNCDAERLARDVLEPFAAGRDLQVRPYLCSEDRLGRSATIPACGMMILEGSYVNLKTAAAMARVRVFIRLDAETQQRRLAGRNTPEEILAFRDRWIPLENAYFTAYGLPDRDCLVLNGNSLRIHELKTEKEEDPS